MKKICFVTTVYETLKTFVMEMAEYLYHKNIDIYFICDYNEEFKKQLPEYIHYLPVGMSRGIDVKAIKSIWLFYKIFKKEKFDLVQYATPNASLYASIASFLARTSNRLYAQWGIYYVSLRGVKRWLFKTFEKTTCILSTHIQPISILNREYGISEKLYTEKKSSVIGFGSVKGVDFKRFDIDKKDEFRKEIRNTYEIDKDDMVFGFVGRITRDKGINETIIAFRNFVSKNLNSWLLICGDEDVSPKLDQEALNWAKSNDRVIFCGRVINIEKYYAAMDVFLFPSYREGFGEVAIEAQAMGIPVITTNIPGPADSVKEGVGGIQIKSRNAIDLYDAMEYISNNKNKAIAMGIDGMKWIHEKYDTNYLVEKICNFKIDIIENNKRIM